MKNRKVINIDIGNMSIQEAEDVICNINPKCARSVKFFKMINYGIVITAIIFVFSLLVSTILKH